jgi:hypothetical protein
MEPQYRRRALATWVLAAALLLALGTAGVQAQDGEWEWQNPLPQGHHLWGVWGSSGSDVFAVGGLWGSCGTIVHYDGTTWTVMDSGALFPLFGVWGSSGSDVFAVGWGGTILHYRGAPPKFYVYLPLVPKHPPYSEWPP